MFTRFRKSSEEGILYRGIILALLCLFAVVFAVPLVWTFLTSLKHPGRALDGNWLPYEYVETLRLDGRAERFHVLEKQGDSLTVRLETTGEMRTVPAADIERLSPYLGNYKSAWTTVPFARFFMNSIFVSVCVTLGQLLTCSLGAYAFARLEFPGRDAVFLLYLGTLMIPGQLLTIPLYLILRELGMINTYQGVILPGLFSAYGTFLLRQFFMTIPRDLEDAALIDGAGRMTVYLRIILPLSKAALATLGTFVFIGSWNDFFWPFIVLSDNQKLTLTVGLAMFNSLFRADWGNLMAGAMISLIPAVVVYVIFQRFINRGIVLSGLKG